MTTFTEAEAVLKSCVEPLRVNCVGSACMAWRWGTTVKEGEPYKLHTLFSSISMPGPTIFEQSTTHGYCGMVKS